MSSSHRNNRFQSIASSQIQGRASLYKQSCTRFWQIAVNFWTSPFATDSQMNFIIFTENYKQHITAAVPLSLLYAGEIKEPNHCRDLAKSGCSAPEET